MKFIDLFAGIGGFRYGLQKVGVKSENSTNSKGRTSQYGKCPFRCVYSNEWDKYASQIYKKHYGECDTRDIRTVKADEIPDHDLLCAGFPCQAFSVAGKRRGFEDTRGTLFFDIARIASEKRPRHLLLENVKGLLSHDEGKTFQRILGILSDLGYRVEWQLLNSKHFGVPQNRERVFIIGHLGGGSRRKVFPIGKSNSEDNESVVKLRVQSGYGTKWSNETYVGAKTGLYAIPTNTKLGYDLAEEKNDGIRLEHPNSKTARGRVIKGASQSLKTSAQVGVIENMKIRRLTPTECERLQGFPDGVSRTIKDGGGQGAKTGLYAVKPVLTPDREEKRQNGRRIKDDGEPSFTLTGQDKHGVMVNTRIRRLTPTECERLQGFPDGWTEGVSDTQRYKALGNAVTTNVITAIGMKLLETQEKEDGG